MEPEVSDYRVTRLLYRFVTDEPLDRFERPAPRQGKLGDWDYLLDGGVLHLSATTEFRDRQLARNDVEPLLRLWEQSAELMTPPHRIRFDYVHSDIEEIDPQPGYLNVFPEAASLRLQTFAPTVSVTTQNAEYPAPDPTFVQTEFGARLQARYRKYRAGAADLPAVGYYILDAIEHEFGGSKNLRRNAARVLNVELNVLRTLGDLSARADPDIGRKGGTPNALTPEERAWIDASIANLIRRVGQHASGAIKPPLTMSDLPALT